MLCFSAKVHAHIYGMQNGYDWETFRFIPEMTYLFS